MRVWDRFSRCGVHNRSSCSVSDPRRPGVRRGAPEGAAQSGPDGDPRHAAPSRPAVGEPGDLHLRPGSTRLALAPSLPWHTPKAEDRPRPERTGQEVAEIGEGGRARPAWVQLGGVHSGTDRQARLRVWVRVSGPPSPQALIPAPPRARGRVARKFELAGGGRAADCSSEMQVPDWVRTEPRGCHPRRAPPLPGF